MTGVVALGIVLLVSSAAAIWGVARRERLERLRAEYRVPRNLDTGEPIDRYSLGGQSKADAAAEGAAAAVIGTGAHAIYQYYVIYSAQSAAAASDMAANGAVASADSIMGQFDSSVMTAVSNMSARIPGTPFPSVPDSPEGLMDWYADNVNAATDLGSYMRLKGYVGEVQLNDALVAQGHTVEFAATANNPGWDLLVDGDALVNAKTHWSTYAAAAEAREHPEYAYAVPTDATGPTGPDNLFTVDGYSNASVHESLDDTLGQAADAQSALDTAQTAGDQSDALWDQASNAADSLASGDFIFDAMGAGIPVTLIGFTAYRQVQAVRAGKSWRLAMRDGSVEVVVKGTGMMAGAWAGGQAGAMVDATGVTAFLPIGTAVGTIGGAAAGSMAGATLLTWWKNRPVKAAVAELQDALASYGGPCNTPSNRAQIRAALRAPAARSQAAAIQLGDLHARDRASLRWWLWPGSEQILREQAAMLAADEALHQRRQAEDVVRTLDRRLTSYEGDMYLGLAMANSPELAASVGGNRFRIDRIDRAKQQLSALRIR